MGAQDVARAGSRTVVVADETAFVRDRFRAALSAAGHRVVASASRAELLAEVRRLRDRVDLVLLDVRLSGTGIVSLLRQLRTLLPHQPPIVAFTGTVGTATAVRTLAELQVTAFINEYTGEHHILPALHPFLGGATSSRRQSPRVTIGCAVSVRHGQTVATAIALNLGRGGMALRSTRPLPIGTDARLRFRLPHAPVELDVTATVVWSTPGCGMGVRFTGISQAHQAIVDEFVDTHFFANRKG